MIFAVKLNMSKTITQTKESTRKITSKKSGDDSESIGSATENWDEALPAGQSDSLTSMATAAEETTQENPADKRLTCGRCRGKLSDEDTIIPCEVCKQNFHIQCENVCKTLHKTIMDSKKPRSKVKVH